MWWHILGISPTEDEKTVKRAYAKLIKTINQDTEIEKFTQIHSAYRMAMQSFKKANSGKSNLLMYEGNSQWYLQELTNIYDNPEKRLDAMSWRNLFACMSFKEEEEFALNYVDFFNQFYKLSPNIWQIIEQHYPLSSNKTFLWRDLTNGNFQFSLSEIEQIPEDQAITYLELKIELFYLMLGNEYEKALTVLSTIKTEMFTPDLYRWYFVMTIVDGNDQKITALFNQLSHDLQCRPMALYYFAGYQAQKGDYSKSNELLQQVIDQDSGIKVDLLIGENRFLLDHISFDGMHDLPWIVFPTTTKKIQKHLGKGDYKKALELNNTSKRKGFLGGGR